MTSNSSHINNIHINAHTNSTRNTHINHNNSNINYTVVMASALVCHRWQTPTLPTPTLPSSALRKD